MSNTLRETISALKSLPATVHPWSEDTVLPWADAAFSKRFATEVDYTARFGHPPAGEQVDVLIRQLALPSAAMVLDLCCGAGPHAIELARRGYTVVGVDIGPGAIALARQRAAEARTPVTFIEGDVTDAALAPKIGMAMDGRVADAAFLIRGQVDNFAPASVRVIMTRLAGWLRPQGNIVLEFSELDVAERRSGRSWSIVDGPRSIWADHDTIVLSDSHWHEEAYLQLTRYFVVHPDGCFDRYTSCVQYFVRKDMESWLHDAGFAQVRFARGDGQWTRVIATLES